MKSFYITYQVTQEITEQIHAETAEQAQLVARAYVEDHIHMPLSSYDITLVKTEEKD